MLAMSQEPKKGMDPGLFNLAQRAGAMGNIPMGGPMGGAPGMGMGGMGGFEPGMPHGSMGANFHQFPPGSLPTMHFPGGRGPGPPGPPRADPAGFAGMGAMPPQGMGPGGGLTAEMILRQAQRLETDLTNGWITPEEAASQVEPHFLANISRAPY